MADSHVYNTHKQELKYFIEGEELSLILVWGAWYSQRGIPGGFAHELVPGSAGIVDEYFDANSVSKLLSIDNLIALVEQRLSGNGHHSNIRRALEKIPKPEAKKELELSL